MSLVVSFVSVKVNAQTATPTQVTYAWCHRFDFTTGQHGWATFAHFTRTSGTYSAGVGWLPTDTDVSAVATRQTNLAYTITTPATITNVTMGYDYTFSHHEFTGGNVGLLQMEQGNTADFLALERAEMVALSFDGTNKEFHRQAPTTWSVSGSIRVVLLSSVDNFNPRTYGGSLVIRFLEFRGTGTSPFPASNCGSFAPTATPMPTYTDTPPVDEDFLCPQELVNPSTVNGAYQVQCLPCLSSYTTPVPYSGLGTATPTLTPVGYTTPTAFPNIGTYQPAPTDIPDATPAPEMIYCNFFMDCDFVSLVDGHIDIDDGVVADDYLIQAGEFAGEYWRVIKIIVSIPVNQNNIPEQVSDLSITFEFEGTTFVDDNLYVYLVAQSGVLVEQWRESFSNAEHTYTIEDINVDTSSYVYYVHFYIIADIGSAPEFLDGTAFLTLVELTYLPTSDNSIFDDDVVCHLPQDYAALDASDYLNFSLGGYLQTTCHTIIPFIDLTIITDVIETFGWDVGDWFIPRVDLCIDWYALPYVVLFGFVFPLTMIPNLYVIRQLIKLILKF